MTHPTDEELDALVQRAKERAKEDRQIQANNEAVAVALKGQRLLFDQGFRSQSNTFAVRLGLDYENCAKKDARLASDWEEAADAITALRAQLAEAQFDRDNNRAKLEVKKQELATARADRAAQIEADAGIADALYRMALKDSDDDLSSPWKSHKASAYGTAAQAIRNQPHDRSALDRMLAEHEVRLREAREISEAEKIAIRNKALREAAEICSSIRQRIANGPMPEGARFDYEQSILALIDSEQPKENMQK